MRKFDLSLRSSRSSYFATFRHQLTILSKTDALDEEKWLNMLGTFVKDSPSPTKSSNLSETAEVPACNVPSRSPLPALAIAPETKLGTASSGLGTLEP